MATDPGGFSVDPAVLTERLKTSFGEFFQKLGTGAKAIDAAFTHVQASIDNCIKIGEDWQEMKANIEEEVQKLKDFEFDVHWKTRVINVPVAITQIRDLLDEIFNQVKEKLEDVFQPLAAIKDSIKEYRDQLEEEGHTDALAVASTTEILVTQAIENVRESMDAAKDVTELFIDITQRIQSGSDLFLQQGNPRERVTEKTSRRVGKLHS